MKTPAKQTLWFTGIGLAIWFLLPGCVVPYDYDDDEIISHSVTTTYSPGYVTSTLPRGYRTEIIGGTPYYVSGSTYYRPYSTPGSFVVVEPPRTSSFIIEELPPGYRTIRYGGSVYYQHRNSFYQRRGDGYVIVPSPFSDMP